MTPNCSVSGRIGLATIAEPFSFAGIYSLEVSMKYVALLTSILGAFSLPKHPSTDQVKARRAVASEIQGKMRCVRRRRKFLARLALAEATLTIQNQAK